MTTTITSPEKMLELVQGQLVAYNKKDLDAFCNYFHPDVEVYRLNQNEMTCRGIETFKGLYQNRFSENPNLLCEIKHRTVLQNTILDEEWITGVEGVPTPGHVVAIYAFRDNLIAQVWFAR